MILTVNALSELCRILLNAKTVNGARFPIHLRSFSMKGMCLYRLCLYSSKWRSADDGIPAPGHIPVGKQFTGKAEERNDAKSGVLRPAAERPREEVPDSEVHFKAGQEEIGRETGTEGLAGMYADVNGRSNENFSRVSNPRGESQSFFRGENSSPY